MSFNWLSVIAILMALIVVVAGFRGHRLGFERGAWMAVAWIVLIGVAAFVFARMGWQ